MQSTTHVKPAPGAIFPPLDINDRDIAELLTSDKMEMIYQGSIFRYSHFDGFYFKNVEVVTLDYSLEKSPMYRKLFTREPGLTFYRLMSAKECQEARKHAI